MWAARKARVAFMKAEVERSASMEASMEAWDFNNPQLTREMCLAKLKFMGYKH